MMTKRKAFVLSQNALICLSDLNYIIDIGQMKVINRKNHVQVQTLTHGFLMASLVIKDIRENMFLL